jgi:nitrous oxidase accessory protein NosD
VFIGLIIAALSAPTQAETINCTAITSLPYTISTQGVYCLTGNLATAQTTGSAITISANNGTLDLNGWKLGGQAAGVETQSNGIHSFAVNVTVKNGIVRGFYNGIYLFGRGAVVEELRVDQSTRTGIYVAGAGSLVRRNQVVDTGGSTVMSSAFGIANMADGARIEQNTVSGLAPGTGTAYGIFTNPSVNSLICGNFLANTAASPSGVGISLNSTSRVTVVDNVVRNFSTCVYYAPTATGLYARNVADGCRTKYSGGTAGTGND